MAKAPSLPAEMPDLSEHEEEVAPFEDVMRKLLAAKPAPKKPEQDEPEE